MTREEAIKIVQSATVWTAEERDALAMLIPELAESEDEKIRRTLVEYFGPKAQLDFVRGIPIQKIRDWLEKQKEQKPIKLNDDTEVGLDRALQIVKAAKGNLCGYQSDDGIYECCHAIQTLESILKNGIEQKPAEWNEEDEIMIGSLINYFEGDALDCSLDCVVNWFKSLRPPLKDREMKLKILKYLSTRCSSLEFEEVEDYLNNLRPSWKPSEEQMEAFKDYIEDFQAKAKAAVGGWNNFDVMIELYEQLKKL